MKSVLGLLLILCLYVTGCSSDEDEYREPVSFVSASPPSGSEMRANMTITVTFDNPPRDVTSSAGVATVVGKKAIISGPFTPGPLAITITWSDGSQTLNYTI